MGEIDALRQKGTDRRRGSCARVRGLRSRRYGQLTAAGSVAIADAAAFDYRMAYSGCSTTRLRTYRRARGSIMPKSKSVPCIARRDFLRVAGGLGLGALIGTRQTTVLAADTYLLPVANGERPLAQ